MLLDAVNSAFPGLELIGGTTNSELSSQEGFQQDSLVRTLFSEEWGVDGLVSDCTWLGTLTNMSGSNF